MSGAMYRFHTMFESPMAYTLVERLNEASIPARLTLERSAAGLYTGITNAIIWLEDESQRDEAAAIHKRLVTEQTEKSCPHCSYSLAGHAGAVNCPECGRPTTAPTPDLRCHACGETVPPTFEICWNCGEAIDASN